MPAEFDLIIYGATGFTGRRAAAYLVEHAPKRLRWAIAGRDPARLHALGTDRPVIAADARDLASLRALAARARVVLNFAGPFRRFGDPLITACIAEGSHYCDISGETARIRDLMDGSHAAAERARVKIVPFCGVSSVPADLGVYLLHQRLDGLAQVKGAVAIKSGFLNGGTVQSISSAIESGDALRERDPFLLGPATRAPGAVERDPTGVHYDRDLKAWVVASPMGLSDTRAVRRSGVLTGRDIVFQEYSGFAGRGALPRAAGMAAMLGLMNAAFRWGPTRRWIAARVQPGQGPSEAQIDSGFYRLTLWGRAVDGREAQLTISGHGDPGNRITTLCACESALALALDGPVLPDRFGVLTPSTAMGDALATRLRSAGLEIR